MTNTSCRKITVESQDLGTNNKMQEMGADKYGICCRNFRRLLRGSEDSSATLMLRNAVVTPCKYKNLLLEYV